MILCGTWYGHVGVWVRVLWWDERCDWFKNTLLTDFFDRHSRKGEKKSTEFASRIAQSKNVESKKLFFDRVRSPIWASVENGPFRLTDPNV